MKRYTYMKVRLIVSSSSLFPPSLCRVVAALSITNPTVWIRKYFVSSPVTAIVTWLSDTFYLIMCYLLPGNVIVVTW